MWRETNFGGVYLPPLLAYMLVAALVFLPVRWVIARLRLRRWVWNPRLAETAIYLCILGVLVTWF